MVGILAILMKVPCLLKEKLNQYRAQNPSAPPNSGTDGGDNELESNIGAGGQHNAPPQVQNHEMMWGAMVFGICLACVSATIQALQTQTPLSVTSQYVYIGLVISCTALLVSISVGSDVGNLSAAMMYVGVFFGATALMLALVINLSITFMIPSVFFYFMGIITIIFIKIQLNPGVEEK